MKIKVLGFKNSDRQKLTRKNLKGIPFELFEPITPDEKLFDYDKSKLWYVNNELSKEEISCSISHYQIITGNKVDIILEDDALPIDLESFKELKYLKQFIETLSEPTVIIVGHSKVSKHDLFLQKLKQPLINQIKIKNYTIGENNKINYYGTVAYMFNTSFSNQLKTIKCFWRADDWETIKNHTGCKIYHLRELLVLEDLKSMKISQVKNKIHSRHDFKNKPISNILKIIRAQVIYLLNKSYFKSE
jgi:GR25 family glycosyltransferase involved in LPS biosynthesis